MTVQDLNRVHRRYIRVSNFFKSVWTFHQFIQGLHKVFPDLDVSGYPADFQSVYGELKQVSQNLSETTTEAAEKQLDAIEQNLEPLTQSLLEIDEEVSPALLRMFFQRVKNYDDNILTQLIKFYLYSREESGWNLDRLDKADYLATKLAEEHNEERDVFVLRDPSYLREVTQSFWTALGIQEIEDEKVEQLKERLEGLGGLILGTDSMDDLHQQDLISTYRDIKHSLGDHFFQPSVTQALLTTNLVLKNQIQRLYQREEQRIIAEYQQVFELERDVPVDVHLGEELSQFRLAVERFEEQLQGENVRLDELAQLREKVRELVPRLQPEMDPQQTGPFVPPKEAREYLADQQDVLPKKQQKSDKVPEHEYVRAQYDNLIATLDNTNSTMDPRKVALQPEVFGLGLSPREIVAYRRLYGGGVCDRELEKFVLCAASLRARIEMEVEEIKGILDDTAVTREAPIFAKARMTARYGGLFLRQFSHRGEQAVLDGDISEARALQLLKMRMMRAYSGLWLMVHRQ